MGEGMNRLRKFTDAEITSEYNRRRSAKRGDKTGGRPEVLRPCKKCGGRFPTAELRKHQPQCEGKK
jgi:hypothetical protein